MSVSKRDLNYLNLARQTALTSQCRWKLGSCLVSGGSVKAVSPNIKRHDGRYIIKYTRHAEHCTIVLAGANSRGSTIYTVRVGANGEMRMAKPCQDCTKLLFDVGVNRVVWSTGDGNYDSARIRELLERD